MGWLANYEVDKCSQCGLLSWAGEWAKQVRFTELPKRQPTKLTRVFIPTGGTPTGASLNVAAA